MKNSGKFLIGLAVGAVAAVAAVAAYKTVKAIKEAKELEELEGCGCCGCGDDCCDTDCCCDDDDCCCDEDFMEAMCPHCKETICFDNELDPADLICPACGKNFAE